jgi:TP901 family phage tail tape measure protein
MTRIRTTAEQFSHSLEKNKLTMGEYFRYAGGASKTFGKLFKSEFETINKVARERVKDLQSQYIKLGRDANGAMQAIKVRPLALDMQNLGTKTQIAAQRQQLLNQLLKQGSTNLLNFGKNTQWAGRQLMVGFTIPLSIMGGAAMKAYQQIEEASIKLKRVYGDLGTTTAETNKMVEQVKQLALEYTKYGVAVKDSMDMAASAAATGKKGADLIAQVNSATKLSVLGGVDQQKALQTTISLTNAFNISSKDLAKNINFLNAVENQTVLNIDDMTTAIPKAAPVIQQLGGDVKDLAFFLTAMKEGGVNASEGANALKSGLASLINPTNTASKMLAGFGINIKGIVEKDKGDLKKTVVDFAQALDTLDPLNRARAIEQLFGKFQFARMSTLFKNVIAQGSQASEVLKLAGTSSLELAMLSQKELNKIQESPLYKFQKAIADFQAQLAPVGEQFMKAITPIINFGTDVLKNFNSLGDGVKGFIVKFVSIAGVVGPVLLMSFGLIANAVANVIKGFALMKDIFNRTGKSSLSLGEQVNYMTQEQINAAAIASSLDQVHSKLKQTFTSEAAAVDMLTAAYERSVAAQRAFNVPITPRGPIKKYATGGFISGPGTGTSDSIPAMLSNGEAVIPAKSVAQNKDLVQSLINNSLPRFATGGIIGTPSETLMQQVKGTSAVIAYGAHQPFTSAHQGIAQTGMSMAEQSGIPFFQFTSNQGKAKRSVLGDELKSKMIAEAIGRNPEFAKNPFELMSILSNAGIKNVNILLGEDRMKSPVWDAAAKEFGITITKTGIPRPVGSPSGTMARAAAASGNLGMFESLLASGLSKSTKNEIFKSLFTAGNAKVRKFSDGGMINGPGTGTSDSILAKVSNGEAIIPAKSVARNPYLVRQLISGNIPGFVKGGVFDDPFNLSTKIGLTRRDVMGRPGADPQTAQIHARDAIEAGHTLKSEFKTAEQFLTDIETSMRDMGYSQASINKALKEANKKFDEQKTFLRQQGKTEQEIADYKFQTYGERTVLQPGPVNNKGTGYFSASEVKNFYKPGTEGSFAFANLVPHLKSMKFTDKEIEQILSNMATNLHTGLSKIDDAAQMTLEDLDRLTNTAIDDAVKNDAKAKAAIAKIDNANYTFKTAKAGDNSRLAVGESYKGKQGKRIEQLEQITGQTSPYQTGGRTVFTRGTFEAAGAQYSPRATQQALRQLQIAGGKFEAEANLLIRQYAEKGAAFIPELFRRIEKQLSTIGLTSLPEIEATIARNVGTISTSMVHGLEQGFVNGNKDALAIASPSKKTQALGVQTGRGTVIGIESTIGEAAVAGEMVGKAVAIGARRVTSEGPFITPAGSQSQNILIPNNTNRRVIADNGYDPVTQSYYPKTETPMTGKMYGPEPATKFQKSRLGQLSTKYNNFFTDAGVKVSKMDPGKFQGKMFGTSMGLGMASMFLPGQAGQIAGMASMATGVLGMFKNLGPVVGRLIPLFGKLIPYVGLAITAYEAFDKIILPLIKKNADAYSAVTETLKITQDKLTKINDFFGTDIKLTGVRAMQITGSDQTQAQASIAKQFQASDQFKEVYKPQAEKLKSLSDVEVTNALKALAVDLYGQGMEKEQVKAIIDAIKNEAGKEKISISENIFSLNDPKGQAALKQNAQQAAKNFTKEFGSYWSNNGSTIADQIAGKGEGWMDAPIFRDQQNLEQLKANAATFGSYLSGLSGQLQNGKINTKTFNVEYKQLIDITNKMPNATGLQFFNAALASLGPEAAKAATAVRNLAKAEQELIGEAILKGVTLNQDILNILEFGGDKQRIQQEKNIKKSIKRQDEINAQINEKKKQLTGIQNQTENIQALEGKINDKYDKRIDQLDKIKTLNEQIAKSQQGQLTLAEALNRGDIAAAAKAAIDIQNNDIQAALDNQKTGLEDARKAELKPLQDNQTELSNSVNDLSASIDTLAAKLTTNTPEQAGKAPDVEKGNNKNDFNGWMDAMFNVTRITAASTLDVFSAEYWKDPIKYGQKKQKEILKYLPGFDVVDGKLVPKSTNASGGYITGPGHGTSDDIPAMLSNGEYVIRANAVKTIGVDTLNKLNQADRLGFASGGMVRHFKGGGYNGYADGGYIPREGGLPSNERLPADTANFQHFNGWMIARPGAGINKHGDEIYGYTRNEKTGKYTFDSAADAYRYYRILLKNRRALVPHIEEKYQEHLNGGWMFADDSNNYRISNLVSNKTYGPFNGLTQVEARTFAKSISALYGKKSLPKMWKQFGLDPKLLGKPIKLSPKIQRLYNLFAGEITPALSDNAPRFSYYADGGYVGPRPAPQWDEKGRWVVSRGESYWSTAESTLPGGMSVGPWWSRILKSNIDPTTGKERRLYRNSRIWIPGSQEPFPPKSGIPRIFPKKKKPLYVGGGEPISLIENHMYGGNGGSNGLGNMTKLFANGGLVGYAPGGMVKRDTGAPNPFLDPMGWLQGLINGIYAGGGNPSAYLDNTAAKGIKTGAKSTLGFYKDFIFDPTNPVDYAFAAVPGVIKGVGKKAAQALALPNGFLKAPTQKEMDAVVAFIQNSPLAQIQRGDSLASIVGKSTIAKGTSMFRVPTIRQNQELITKKVGDIIEIGNRFTSMAGQSELQAIGMTAAGKLNTGNRERAVNTILKLVAGYDMPGIMNHKVYNPNYLKNAFGKKADEYPFQSEGLLPPGLKGTIINIIQSGDQRILEVLISKFAKGGMVRGYKDGGKVTSKNDWKHTGRPWIAAAIANKKKSNKNATYTSMANYVTKFISENPELANNNIQEAIQYGQDAWLQEKMEKNKRDVLYKKGGFQGFEAGFNSWAQDLIGTPIIGDALKGIGQYLEHDKVTNFALSSLSLPMNLIGGGVNSWMNTISNIQKGKWMDAAVSATGFPAIGDAFASSYGHIFDPSNHYKSQFEVAAQNVIDNKWFGTADPEQAALARIIGGSLNIAADPTTYLGIGLASKAAKVGSFAAKAGKSVVNAGRTVKDFARTKIAVMNAKKVLGIMGGPEAAKLTPQIGLKMRQEGLENFISDNAYKTIHNDVRSSAGDSISNRVAIEDATGMRRALGLNSEQSPAYGFLGSREAVPNTSYTIYPSQPSGLTPEELATNNFLRQINPNSRPLQTYGSASISLKQSALKNATVSLGDTLSIWEQATKAGIKVPKVARLDSLLTTLKLNSLAKKTKGILGNDFSMPYAEIHLPGGFGLDDVREVGVSSEFANRVPELLGGTKKLLGDAGYANVGVHDILARGNAAFRMDGRNIPAPHKWSDLIQFPIARYKSKAKQYTDTLLEKANKKFVKPIVKPFRDLKTLLLAKQYARKIGEVPHVSDLDIYAAQIQYRMFMDKMNLGKGNTVGAMGVDTHPSEIANQLGIGENDLDGDIFAYISGNIKNKIKKSEVGSFNGVIRENQAPTSSYLNNYVRETTYTADDIYLSLNEKFRGKGIAQKFTTQYMELLKKAGVKKINIDAGLTDGGYAWARAGFRFTERPDGLIERMEMAAGIVDDPKFLDLLHRLQTAPIEDLPLPKEILKLKTNWRKYASEDQIKEASKTLSDRNGSVSGSRYKVNLNTKSLGELFLRGSSWKGSKDLVSPSFAERMKPMLSSAGDLGKSLLQKTKYLTNYKLPYAVKEAAGKVGSLPSLFASRFKEFFEKRKTRKEQENFIRIQDPEMSSIMHALIRKDSPFAAMLLSMFGRHRSANAIDTKNLVHPTDVKIVNDQMYGPGVYFAKTGKDSQKLFSGAFGSNVYKITTSAKNIFQQLLGRHKYLNETKLLEEYGNFARLHPQDAKNYKYDPPTAKLDLRDKKDGSRVDWNDPFIQYLNNKGYIGYSHRTAFTNWRIGVPNSGYGLKNASNRSIFENFLTKSRKPKTQKSRPPSEFYQNLPDVEGSTGGLLKNGKFHYATGGFVMPTPEPAPTQYANGGMVKAAIGGMLINGKFFGGFSRGGMVPSYLAQGGYADGGFAMGTDTVPAMLTPGEFVIKKSAVDRIGASALSKINGYADGGLVGGMSAASGDSVYNSNTYEINVNVSSNSNPNDIANAVMRQIKQVDNGRVRGLNR